MKGSKKGVFSEFLLSPSLGSGSVKGGQFSMTFDTGPRTVPLNTQARCILGRQPPRVERKIFHCHKVGNFNRQKWGVSTDTDTAPHQNFLEEASSWCIIPSLGIRGFLPEKEVKRSIPIGDSK